MQQFESRNLTRDMVPLIFNYSLPLRPKINDEKEFMPQIKADVSQFDLYPTRLMRTVLILTFAAKEKHPRFIYVQCAQVKIAIFYRRRRRHKSLIAKFDFETCTRDE